MTSNQDIIHDSVPPFSSFCPSASSRLSSEQWKELEHLLLYGTPSVSFSSSSSSPSFSSSQQNRPIQAFMGQPVMIPCTSKAFFAGELTPPSSDVRPPTTTTAVEEHSYDSHPPSLYETISIPQLYFPNISTREEKTNTRVELVTMTRKDALHLLVQESNRTPPPSKTTTTTVTTNLPTTRTTTTVLTTKQEEKNSFSQKRANESFSFPRGFLQSKKSSSTQKRSQITHGLKQNNRQETMIHDRNTSTTTNTFTNLPLFEIREEMDMDGKEIRGEKINVLQQLYQFQSDLQSQQQQQQQQQEQEQEQEQDERKEKDTDTSPTIHAKDNHPRTVIHTLLESLQQVVVGNPSHAPPMVPTIQYNPMENQNTDTQKYDTTTVQNTVTHRYDEIRSRLEELELLEQEYESKQNKNMKNSSLKTKALGTGWNRGFLHSPSSKQQQQQQQQQQQKLPKLPLQQQKQGGDFICKPDDNNGLKQTSMSNICSTDDREQQLSSLPSSTLSPSTSKSSSSCFMVGEESSSTKTSITCTSRKDSFTLNQKDMNPMEKKKVKKSVGFTNVDQIQEIPRIGMNSIRTATAKHSPMTSSHVVHTVTADRMDHNSSPYEPKNQDIASFPKSAFSGIVQERTNPYTSPIYENPSLTLDANSKGKSLNRVDQKSSSSYLDSPASTTGTTGSHPPATKLSRFKQQRSSLHHT